MNYAWGSHTAIAALRGETRSEAPQAELWMGAHPKAPSLAVTPNGTLPLDALIADDPKGWLGATASSGLPFLFKVLAAETPLSLQAHPTIEQAQSGYDREDSRGIPVSSPNRNYRDRNHKPELICALTEFHALCGFRAPAEITEMFEELEVAALSPVLAHLSGNAGDLRAAFTALMNAPPQDQTAWAKAVVDSAAEHPGSRFSVAYSWTERLAELYPGDVGVILALWLNVLTLQPGEAIYLPAGVMHAYLGGVGVELMANSDNVLRGGLTPKHVDVPELLCTLRFDPTPVNCVEPHQVIPGEVVYPTPASEFELGRLTVNGVHTMPASGTPAILLVAEGELQLTLGGASLTLKRGQSAALRADAQALRLTGRGVAYRAALPSRLGLQS